MENIKLLKKYLLENGLVEADSDSFKYTTLHTENIIAVSYSCFHNASTFIYQINDGKIICLHEIYEC